MYYLVFIQNVGKTFTLTDTKTPKEDKNIFVLLPWHLFPIKSKEKLDLTHG
jgi:hypothetical protein